MSSKLNQHTTLTKCKVSVSIRSVKGKQPEGWKTLQYNVVAVFHVECHEHRLVKCMHVAHGKFGYLYCRICSLRCPACIPAQTHEKPITAEDWLKTFHGKYRYDLDILKKRIVDWTSFDRQTSLERIKDEHVIATYDAETALKLDVVVADGTSSRLNGDVGSNPLDELVRQDDDERLRLFTDKQVARLETIEDKRRDRVALSGADRKFLSDMAKRSKTTERTVVLLASDSRQTRYFVLSIGPRIIEKPCPRCGGTLFADFARRDRGWQSEHVCINCGWRAGLSSKKLPFIEPLWLRLNPPWRAAPIREPFVFYLWKGQKRLGQFFQVLDRVHEEFLPYSHTCAKTDICGNTDPAKCPFEKQETRCSPARQYLCAAWFDFEKRRQSEPEIPDA